MKTTILLLALVLCGCAFNVEYPAESEASRWVGYYHQQFAQYGYNVVPPEGDAPEVQRQAYMQVKGQYDSFHHNVELLAATILLAIVLGVIAIL